MVVNDSASPARSCPSRGREERRSRSLDGRRPPRHARRPIAGTLPTADLEPGTFLGAAASTDVCVVPGAPRLTPPASPAAPERRLIAVAADGPRVSRLCLTERSPGANSAPGLLRHANRRPVSLSISSCSPVFLYGEMGSARLQITRASQFEPAQGGNRWADMGLSAGPVLDPHGAPVGGVGSRGVMAAGIHVPNVPLHLRETSNRSDAPRASCASGGWVACSSVDCRYRQCGRSLCPSGRRG